MTKTSYTNIVVLLSVLFCFWNSYLLMPYVGRPWHVGQREELVLPHRLVVCVNPKVQT